MNVACWFSAFPMPSTTLASRNAFHALEWPLSPNTPTHSGWPSGTMPLPSRVVISGIWNRSIRRRTWSPAPLRMAPNPASATMGSPRPIASASTAAISSTRPGSGRTGATLSRMSR